MNLLILIAVTILLIHMITLKIFCRQSIKEMPLMNTYERKIFTIIFLGVSFLLLISDINLMIVLLPIILVGHIVGLNGRRSSNEKKVN